MSLPRKLYQSDHLMFRDELRKFLKSEVVPYQAEWERAGIVPKEIWQRCGALGFLAPQVPEVYGGLGLDDYAYQAIIMEELAYANESGLMLPLHNSIVAPYLIEYGSEELKQRVLPKVVSGDCVLAVAMTEPDAGSDLAAMKSTARADGDDWILNGSKTFISNAIVSDAVLVAAKTDPDQPYAVGIFMVERDQAGFSRGERLNKIGMHSQDTGELFFKDVRVPKESVIGHPHQGLKYLKDQLATERLSLCVSSIAIAEAAIKETIKYVKERRAFGTTISKFQNTQFKLAEMQTETAIGRVYVDRMIEEQNNGTLTAAVVCGAKFWTTDLAYKVTDECLQLHGGYGYMREYPISSMYTVARIGKIYAGTNEIMKTVVAKAMDL